MYHKKIIAKKTAKKLIKLSPNIIVTGKVPSSYAWTSWGIVTLSLLRFLLIFILLCQNFGVVFFHPINFKPWHNDLYVLRKCAIYFLSHTSCSSGFIKKKIWITMWIDAGSMQIMHMDCYFPSLQGSHVLTVKWLLPIHVGRRLDHSMVTL